MSVRARPDPDAALPVVRSTVMQRVARTVEAVAAKDVTVTLIGESGTGKEVLARRIHELSERRTGPFIPINCAAIPESLFESELFGHERGAFTGADQRSKGKVEAAAGGTLFLDEIGEMPLGMQVKLLRFLEHRRFMRVGGTAKVQVDVRLLFATLRPLQDDVASGRFRADLYYRIQGITVLVPPLRERRADIGPLMTRFVAELAAKHGTPPPRLGRAPRAAMLRYGWPGNVRELRNAIEMLSLLRPGKEVRMRDLPDPIRKTVAGAEVVRPSPRAGTIEIDLSHSLKLSVDRILRAALDLEGGNSGRAAQRLGVSARTVQRYLARGGDR